MCLHWTFVKYVDRDLSIKYVNIFEILADLTHSYDSGTKVLFDVLIEIARLYHCSRNTGCKHFNWFYSCFEMNTERYSHPDFIKQFNQ